MLSAHSDENDKLGGVVDSFSERIVSPSTSWAEANRSVDYYDHHPNQTSTNASASATSNMASMDLVPNSPVGSSRSLGLISSCSYGVFKNNSRNMSSLSRHYTVWDLISLGVGGTLGSGIFVLVGAIAHEYAGPAAFLSWMIAGVAAATSALGLCELASRIPSTGSTYVYCRVTGMGPSAAVVAAACLTLEYVVCGAAVARTWGDKFIWWCASLTLTATTMGTTNNYTNTSSNSYDDADADDTTMTPLEESYDAWYALCMPFGGLVNVPALLVSLACTAILLLGVHESKRVANIFTICKLVLVAGMIGGGFWLMLKGSSSGSVASPASSSSSLAPYGISGVWRGATASFFGFLGYDEVCIVAGEAVRPKRDVPRAVLATLVIVTICSVGASVALTGMQNYLDISSTNAFPAAFAAHQWYVVSNITATGEVLTLPVVVLISLLAQPRLTHEMARDGILAPRIFQRVNATGNLIWGILVWGIFMTVVAALVPFTYLNDLISCGILVAFCLANTCLLVLRHQDAFQKIKTADNAAASDALSPSSMLEQSRPHHPSKFSSSQYPNLHPQAEQQQQQQQQKAAHFLQYVVLIYNGLCFGTALSWSRILKAQEQQSSSSSSPSLMKLMSYGMATVFTIATIACFWKIRNILLLADKVNTATADHSCFHHMSSTIIIHGPHGNSGDAAWTQTASYFGHTTYNDGHNTKHNNDDDHDDNDEPPPPTKKQQQEHHDTHCPPPPLLNDHAEVEGVDASVDACAVMRKNGEEDLLLSSSFSLSPEQWQQGEEDEEQHFHTPLVPWIPCLGMAINWYLIAQLELFGLLLLVFYLGGTVAVYHCTKSRPLDHDHQSANTPPTGEASHEPENPIYEMTHPHPPPPQQQKQVLVGFIT